MKNWDTLEADVTLLLSTHYTPGRAGSIKYVVVHHNGGNLSPRAIYDVWQYREASAHYQVCYDGTISQHVNDWDTAWHAGDANANANSIGIEHANSWGIDGPITEATLDNGAHLVAAICKHYSLGRPAWGVNVFPHQYFYATACPGHIAEDQRAAYMQRAQAHYDAMMNGTSLSTSPTQEDSMPTAADVWNYKIPGGNGYSAGEILLGTNLAAWAAKGGIDKVDTAALVKQVAALVASNPDVPVVGADAEKIAEAVVSALGNALSPAATS